MNTIKLIMITIAAISVSCSSNLKHADSTPKNKKLFMDVHNLEPGKVTFADVEKAHQKDLASQDKYGVKFLKYWVDEAAGKVYCLADAPDSAALSHTHGDAHGLIPTRVFEMTDGKEAALQPNRTMYLDIHTLGAGNVTAIAVAGAHEKDLATEGKHNVNFINYWVNEKSGIVMCLSQANDSSSIVTTHKEAHGLIPAHVHQVKQGQ
ncbi:MAG: DUF4242 domain-containing protein [Chryseolinea sp.]